MARNFGTTTDKITVASDLGISALPLTLAVKVKVNAFSATDFIFGIYDSTVGTDWISIEVHNSPSDVIRGRMRRSGSEFSTSSALNTAQWYSAMFIIRASNDRELYIDGVSDGINTDNLAFPTLDTTQAGQSGDDSPSDAADVDSCEFMVWDDALADNEIIQYSKGDNLASIRPQNRKLWWSTPGNSSPEADLSGNGNNGTVTGTTKANHAPVGRYVPMPQYRPQIVGGPPPAARKIYQGIYNQSGMI